MATAAYKIVGIAVFGLSVCWLTWSLTDNHWRARWQLRNIQEMQAEKEAAAKAKAKETEWQEQYAALDADYQQKIRANNAEKDRAIAAYRAGQLKLRNSLSCTTSNMPATATATGVGDAAAKCGLQSDDVEFLIRYASDAEATRQQLIAAQTLLRTIYSR